MSTGAARDPPTLPAASSISGSGSELTSRLTIVRSPWKCAAQWMPPNSAQNVCCQPCNGQHGRRQHHSDIDPMKTKPAPCSWVRGNAIGDCSLPVTKVAGTNTATSAGRHQQAAEQRVDEAQVAVAYDAGRGAYDRWSWGRATSQRRYCSPADTHMPFDAINPTGLSPGLSTND